MTERLITRVVIACDPVGENRSSIVAAARVAAWLNATLHGVFFEDEVLLHLANMPFARHIGAGGEIFASIDENALRHQFEAHAARIRTALKAAADAQAIDWSFGVVSGPSTVATLAIGDKDLLVIEAESRPFAGAVRFDSRWLAAAFETPLPILLIRSGADAPHDIVALVETGGPAAERLVASAARLALAGNRMLTVLLANDACDSEAAREAVRAVSGRLAAKCRIDRLSRAGQALANAATAGRLLIVDADPAVNDAATLRQLLAATRADILFLR